MPHRLNTYPQLVHTDHGFGFVLPRASGGAWHLKSSVCLRRLHTADQAHSQDNMLQRNRRQLLSDKLRARPQDGGDCWAVFTQFAPKPGPKLAPSPVTTCACSYLLCTHMHSHVQQLHHYLYCHSAPFGIHILLNLGTAMPKRRVMHWTFACPSWQRESYPEDIRYA